MNHHPPTAAPDPPPRRGLRQALILGLLALLLALVVVTCGLGYIRVAPDQVARVVLAHLTGGEAPVARLVDQVVWEVRLPRILSAAAVGAALALAGVVFQGILLNPLADPFTLGVSSGAAFGAALALWLGLAFLGPYTVALLAFLGAVATLAAVIALAAKDGQTSPTSLILSGVIVAAILSAGISFIKYLSGEQVSVIIFWLLGSLSGRTWLEAGLTGGAVIVGFLVFLFHARDLNLLSLGPRAAAALGVEVRRVRLILLITASLVSAAAVAVAGIIGFVGLLIPHLMRMLVGPDNRLLLPAAGLAGAMLLLLADTLTRWALPHEVPIGVLTALIGGPFFCYVFRRKQLGVGRG
ncbi:MAG: iron ABC transporter permease [Desulfarculus sp.]|nr:iron ABC transporter permease [Desulfarculus sp.]